VPYGRNFPNINDGANGLGKGDGQRTTTGFGLRQPSTSPLKVMQGGTSEQKHVVNSLTAPVLGVPVTDMSDVATLLFLPAMSGSEVSVQ